MASPHTILILWRCAEVSIDARSQNYVIRHRELRFMILMDALCLSHTKWEEHFFTSQYEKWEYLTLGREEQRGVPVLHVSIKSAYKVCLMGSKGCHEKEGGKRKKEGYTLLIAG